MEKISGYKILLAVVLVVAVGVALWFAAPVRNSADAYNDEGFTQNTRGDFNTAVDTLTKAIELDPELAVAHNNRGWANIELGQYEQGITDCTKAIELDPELAMARLGVGADTDNNGAFRQDIVVAVTEAARLLGASGGVVFWIEVDHNLPAAEVLETYLVAGIVSQSECRCFVAFLEHVSSNGGKVQTGTGNDNSLDG